MIGVIFAGVLLICSGIGLAIFCEKFLPLALTAIGVVVILIGFSVTFIPSGYVGVKTCYGQISEEPIGNGYVWHAPIIEQIHKVNCKQQEKVYQDLKVWSETSERTELYCENISIDYQIDSEHAAWIWINVEEYDTNLIKQTSIESGIKAATKKFNDTDVTDRSKIESAVKESIQKSLNAKYGKQIVNIISVTIGNINFSDAYNEAIEKKAQTKIAAETAQAAAKQKEIEAEAAAKAKKIAAEGEAEAIKIKADAQAEANKKIAESLTDNLIELKKIEKWDGKLPQVMGSDTNTIFKEGSDNRDE